ncbi:MAG: hypothetical protein AAF990_25630 [Bacteroidota bacterium]
MKLDDLKPAWKLFQHEQQFNQTERMDVLALIEQTHVVETAPLYTQPLLINALLFLLFLVSCQGG